MPGEFLSFGTFVVSWAATYFVHSTCLLACVWLVLRVYRSAGHTLCESLWKTALVGGVVTASLQMSFASGWQFREIDLTLDGSFSPDYSATAAPVRADGIPAGAGASHSIAMNSATRSALLHDPVSVEGEREMWIGASGLSAEFADFRDEANTAGAPQARGVSAIGPAAGSWNSTGERIRQHTAAGAVAIAIGVALIATLLGIARFAWQTLALRRKLAHCSVIDAGPARRLLDGLRRLVPKTPDVVLLLAPDDPEPAAFGVRRWAIVLPRRALHDLSEDELRALLAHELAHLVRGDSIWLYISRVICSCLAFQPLNHLARREWQRAAEFLCDNWAVSRTGTPLALARCLAEVAGWRLSGRASAALLAATGRKSGLVGRIERLLDARPVSETWNDVRAKRRLLVEGAMLLALLTWCAPRVQIAVANADRSSNLESHRTRIDDDNRPLAAKDAGDPAAASDAAKTPPDGSSAFQDGAQPSDPTGTPASAADERSSNDIPGVLEALARELHELERELGEIQPLLLQGSPPPPLVQLAERLQTEIAKLKQSREALQENWKRSVRQLGRK